MDELYQWITHISMELTVWTETKQAEKTPKLTLSPCTAPKTDISISLNLL